MLLDRLESGFLLYETERGLVRVELAFWQRLYLLWTFRNFRKLSVPLLNARQRALVNALFRNRSGVVSHSYDPWSVIGVVEHFAPPPINFDAPPAVKSAQQEEQPVAQLAKVVSAPATAQAKRKAKSTVVVVPRNAATTLATTAAALCLGVFSVIAWHRIQAIPASQAHSQPRMQQIEAIAPPVAATSEKSATVVAESSDAVAVPIVNAEPVVVSAAAHEAEAKAASIAASVPVPVPVPANAAIPTPIAAVPITPILVASRVTPAPKQTIRTRVAASTRPLVGQADGIQATRPPLRFAYPEPPDGRTRGVVSLTAEVDSDGAVRSVKVVSGNRALAAAAVRAVRQWRYRPYLKDGTPVATETNIVISFISNEAISMTFPPSLPGR